MKGPELSETVLLVGYCRYWGDFEFRRQVVIDGVPC